MANAPAAVLSHILEFAAENYNDLASASLACSAWYAAARGVESGESPGPFGTWLLRSALRVGEKSFVVKFELEKPEAPELVEEEFVGDDVCVAGQDKRCLALLPQTSWYVAALKWRSYLVERKIPLKEARFHASSIRAWGSIRSVLSRCHLNVLKTLYPGWTAEQWGNVMGEDADDFPGLRAIYSVHGGQKEHRAMREMQPFECLFGGYSVYDMLNVMFLRASPKAHQARYAGGARMRVFAESPVQRVQFAVNAAKPGIYVQMGEFDDGATVYVQAACDGDYSADMFEKGESVIAWFCEYASRLTSGMYAVNNIIPDIESHCIDKFPQSGELFTCAITKGIRVTASSIFMPTLHGNNFVYSIRIKLLKPGEDEGALTEDERGFQTAQLLSRHWEISDGRNPPSRTEGLAVVGKVPLLYEDAYRDDELAGNHGIKVGMRFNGEFVYQSQTGPMELHPRNGGTFGGWLTFVPGTLA